MAKDQAESDDFAHYNGVVDMDNLRLTEEAYLLANKIRSSSLYQNYLVHRNVIEKDTALMERVRAFKRAQIALETKRSLSGITFEEEKQVSHLYTELSLHPIAGAFLDAENQIATLYRSIVDSIYDGCELEVY